MVLRFRESPAEREITQQPPSQFEEYDRLEEFDWQRYRKKYGDIQRLDRILQAENDTPNRYKVSKQADVLMLFSLEEIYRLFRQLG